jgi:hypothetical protein
MLADVGRLTLAEDESPALQVRGRLSFRALLKLVLLRAQFEGMLL